jgi:hypothetical protein
MVDPSNSFRAVRVGSESGAGLAGWQAVTGRTVVPVTKVPVTYWCPKGHQTTPVFANLSEADIPSSWDCPHCGQTAAREPGMRIAPRSSDEPYKSHLEYAKERRSPDEAEAVVEQALEKLRSRRHEALQQADPAGFPQPDESAG